MIQGFVGLSVQMNLAMTHTASSYHFNAIREHAQRHMFRWALIEAALFIVSAVLARYLR
jgi:hypothetical protein